jgi:hypothetical protein
MTFAAAVSTINAASVFRMGGFSIAKYEAARFMGLSGLRASSGIGGRVSSPAPDPRRKLASTHPDTPSETSQPLGPPLLGPRLVRVATWTEYFRNNLGTTDDEPLGSSQPLGPPTWTEHFWNILRTADDEPLGSFAATRRLKDIPYLFPMISVEGVGDIPLPLIDSVSEKLVSVARKAPFGVGSETLQDDQVRQCWEIEASKVSMMQSGEAQDFFAAVVQESCYQLGISESRFQERKIRANLYKMLLYEVNGHFLPHRDSEKEDGMFGTLIPQLPSAFSGGLITVKHDGKEVNLDNSNDAASTIHATALYADCEHQLHPIRSGRRLCLVFNLIADPNTQIPSNAVNANVEAELVHIANHWKKLRNPGEMRLGYPLKHFYTPNSFSFASMKREDAHVLTTLTNAKSLQGQPLFDVWLMLMERLVATDDDFNEEVYVLKVFDRNGDELKLNERKQEWPLDKDVTGWKMFQRLDGWMLGEGFFEAYVDEIKSQLPYEDQDYQWGVPFTPYSLAFNFDMTEMKDGCEYTGNESFPDEKRYHAGAIVISPAQAAHSLEEAKQKTGKCTSPQNSNKNGEEKDLD